MERMTAQQAPQAQRDSTSRAVFLHRFEHVFRTGWLEAAGGGQQRRDKALVKTQSGDYRFPHCVTNRSTARRSSSGDAVKAARRGLITISHCGPISGKRTRRSSRNRLFTRLRLTAFPKARGTVNPSLGPWRSSLGTCRQNAAKYGLVIRLPLLYAVRKSEVLRIRALFGKPKLVGVPDGSLVTHREFMAALGAAPRDYCPSIFGAHAYQEPVRLRPFTVIRLKCAFWHLNPSTRARYPKLRS